MLVWQLVGKKEWRACVPRKEIALASYGEDANLTDAQRKALPDGWPPEKPWPGPDAEGEPVDGDTALVNCDGCECWVHPRCVRLAMRLLPRVLPAWCAAARRCWRL